jgi:hypothetical protein
MRHENASLAPMYALLRVVMIRRYGGLLLPGSAEGPEEPLAQGTGGRRP